MTSPLGREIDRVDGRSKATGVARYSADNSAPNMLHACVVTSTIAKGSIVGMDTSAAKSVPGVVAVYNHESKLGLQSMRDVGDTYAALGDEKVHYRGQIIAVVVAETFEQARDAAALVTTTYRTEQARTSLPAGSPGVTADRPGEPPARVQILARGVDSIDAALAASDVVVRADFHQPAQHHAAMEPHATLAEWVGSELTVHTGAQIPHIHAMVLTGRLGLVPSERGVRVITPHVGGAFGSRVLSWHDTVLAAAAAYRRKRPVKLVLTREQVFTVVGHRNQVNQTVKLGASRDGILTAISHESDAEIPAVGGLPMWPARGTSGVLYKTPNLYYDQRVVTLDTPPTAAMRAPHEAAGGFALETAMDELAVATGIDPVELRLRNYAAVVPGTNRPWSSKHLDECYRIGARRFGWSDRRAKPRSRVDGQWLVGMGMASAIYQGGRRPDPVSVEVQLLDDDTAIVSSATSDAGTGARTMLAIIGAHELGIHLRQVRPQLGDSFLPRGAPAAASAATASTVPGVHDAAQAVITALKELAVSNPQSPWHGGNVNDVRYEHGRLLGAGHSMTFGRLLTIVGERVVAATATVRPDNSTSAEYEFHSFGAHFCEVRVNRFTGEPRVTRFTTVVDIGRVVNAQAARSQITGGVIFGIGYALLEENPLEWDTGRLAGSNLADYMVPVNADVPEIDVHFIDRPDPVVNGLGARGCGEIGNVGSAAAIGNAIYNATGKRIHDVPITLDKLL